MIYGNSVLLNESVTFSQHQKVLNIASIDEAYTNYLFEQATGSVIVVESGNLKEQLKAVIQKIISAITGFFKGIWKTITKVAQKLKEKLANSTIGKKLKELKANKKLKKESVNSSAIYDNGIAIYEAEEGSTKTWKIDWNKFASSKDYDDFTSSKITYSGLSNFAEIEKIMRELSDTRGFDPKSMLAYAKSDDIKSSQEELNEWFKDLYGIAASEENNISVGEFVAKYADEFDTIIGFNVTKALNDFENRSMAVLKEYKKTEEELDTNINSEDNTNEIFAKLSKRKVSNGESPEYALLYKGVQAELAVAKFLATLAIKNINTFASISASIVSSAHTIK